MLHRHYCEVADVDVKNAHMTASPVDNLASVPSRATTARIKTHPAQRDIIPEVRGICTNLHSANRCTMTCRKSRLDLQCSAI